VPKLSGREKRMSSNTVTEFANELKMAPAALLEQLRGAGVRVNSVNDAITEADKAQLLESLRRAHGAREGTKITLTRKQTSEIRQADASGRARTIPVEVRKKRVFVKRDVPDPSLQVPERAAEAARGDTAGEQSAVDAARAEAVQARTSASVPVETSTETVPTSPTPAAAAAPAVTDTQVEAPSSGTVPEVASSESAPVGA